VAPSAVAIAVAALAALSLAACAAAEPAPSTTTLEPTPSAGGWRLVVLGIAQDGGMPHIGCVKEPCASARRGERPAARVACLGLTDGARTFLFDATPDLPAQLHAMGARRPDGVFLTHAHVGHYLGLAFLGKEALGGKGIPVYATESMRAFLGRDAPWRLLVEEGRIDLRDNARVDLGGGMMVESFRVPHRAEVSDTVAYVIRGPRRSALFVPDTDTFEKWDRDVRGVVEGVDLAFLDATFWSADELPGRAVKDVPHPLVPDTMERLAGLGARVCFLHLNHSNPLFDDPARVEPQGFRVAREGEAFDL
jgi:pyrroloquinoline quinone biosynthesis protein B